MPFYIADLSPFGVPHRLHKDASYVLYQDLHNNFSPTYEVAQGRLVADIKTSVCGRCTKLGRVRRKKGIFALLEGVSSSGRNKNCRLTDCVGVPGIKEFVRNKTTKKWYQMLVAHPKFAELRPVLIASEDEDNNADKNKPADTTAADPAANATANATANDNNDDEDEDNNDDGDEDMPILATLSPRMVLTKQKYIDAFIEHWVANLPDISDFPDIPPTKIHFWKRKSRQKRKKPHRTLTGMCAKWFNDAIDFGIKMNKWAVRYVRRLAKITCLCTLCDCSPTCKNYKSVYCMRLFADLQKLHVCVLCAIVRRLAKITCLCTVCDCSPTCKNYMSVYFRFEGDDGCKVDLVPEFIVTVWLHYITIMTGKPDASMNSAQLVLKYLLMNANLVHNAWCVRACWVPGTFAAWYSTT